MKDKIIIPFHSDKLEETKNEEFKSDTQPQPQAQPYFNNFNI